MAASQDEAVNLLSLDGGGVRGVSSLVILDAIMRKIKDEHGLPELPKPCEFFHMIAGTSTGGLIAIMLGRLRMSTQEALQEYDNCAAKIFSKENKKKMSITEKFRATALQEVVEDLVKRRGMGERMWHPENPDKGKAIVCVMPSHNVGRARVVRTFPGDEGVDEQWDRDILIWQAARATTAASTYFKPQKLGSGSAVQTYVDAAIGANNPVDYLLEEAIQEFGTGRRLGCIVSIGTGTREIKLSEGPNDERKFIQTPTFAKFFLGMVKARVTDTEPAHRELEARLNHFLGAYFRFNVQKAAEQIGLHHYEKMPELKTMTLKYLEDQNIVQQVETVASGLKNDGFCHGLTLGLIRGLDKDQIILSNAPVHAMGMSSSFFTGREDILRALDLRFARRNTGGQPRRECLLHGAPGVGKTEIARKAAELLQTRGPHQQPRFRYVFFINGASLPAIRQSYAQICRQHRLGNGSPEDMQNLAVEWIEGLTEEWLMIFDDCDLSDRRYYLPGGGTGNIIYTSRLTALTYGLPANCVFEVQPLGAEDAVKLLFEASGSQSTRTNSQDTTAAQELVEELGYLPLGIVNAAATIRADGVSLSTYLAEFRAGKVSILRNPRFQGKHIENTAVYTTLELSYKAILARRRRGGRQAAGRSALVALKLLALLCFYHHKDFPLSVFGRAARERRKRNAHKAYPLSTIMDPSDADFDFMLDTNADGSWDANWVAVGLRILESFSLVKRDREQSTVSMHALVHAWAEQRMEEEERWRHSLIAKIIICESIELSWRWLDQSFARSLGPHASVCLAHRSRELHHEEYEAQLQLKLGWQYELNKDFDNAERIYLACLRHWKVEHGNDSWSVINTLQRLGALYHDMGRLGDAEVTYLEMVERLSAMIRNCEAAQSEEQDQKPTPDTDNSSVRSTGDLGTVSEPRSKPLSRSALTWYLKRHRKRTSKSNGVDGRGKSSMLPAPEPEETEFEDTAEELDRLWIHFYITHGYLAKVYMDQDRFGMGKRMLVRVAQYLEELLPEDHPELLRVQHQAKALTDPGDLEFWNKRVNDWCDMAADEPGNEHWESDAGWQLMVAFADCQLKNGMYDMAHEQYTAALALFERIYGRYDKKVLDILRRMVICKVEGDDCDKALEIARDCLQRARRCYGDCHLETVLAMEKLYEASFFQKLEHGYEEEKILREAVVRAEEALGLTHSVTRRIRTRLGRITRDDKKPAPIKLENGLPKKRTMEEAWRDSKAELEDMKIKFGKNHLLVRRFARFVGDRPCKTREEHAKRLLACFGPHCSATQACLDALQREKDALAVIGEGDGGSGSARSRPSRLVPDFCSCGEPAHAEGSRWRELQASGTGQPAEEAGAAVAAEETPATTETSLDDLERGVERWRNRPFYFCGLY